MMEARGFLETVAGFTRSATDGSSDRPIRIAVVDPGYSGTGLPRVTFEGESTMSVKGYPFVDSYWPVAGDRVVLLPIGNTYWIVGRIDTTVRNLVQRVATLESQVTTLQTETTWAAPAFASTWGEYGSNQETVQYRKDRNGQVFVKGLLKPTSTAGTAYGTGSVNGALFTVPAGFRPLLEHIFIVPSNGGALEIRMSSGGLCYFQRVITGTGPTRAAATWISVASITFPGAQ